MTALSTIFKAYDVRGIYPEQLDEGVSRRLGAAFDSLNGWLL
jgi:phosphomannomutase